MGRNYNIDGKFNDRFEIYHDNGQLYQKGVFKNGKKY